MLDEQHLAVSVSTSSKLSMRVYECGDQTPDESEQTLHGILNKSFGLHSDSQPSAGRQHDLAR